MLVISLNRFVCLLAGSLTILVGQPSAGAEFTTIDYPGAVSTNAVAIGMDGTILGRWQDGGGYTHGFLTSGGGMVSFDCQGAASTSPRAMNSRNEVVGSYQDAAGKWAGFYLDISDPAAWEAGGAKCTSLEPKGSVGRNSGNGAFGIGENGEISGWYDDAKGSWHGFLYRGGVYLSFDMMEGAAAGPMGMSPLAMSPQGELIGHMQVTGDRMRGWFITRNRMHVLDFPPGASNGMTCGFAGNSKGEIVGHYQRNGEIIRGLYYKDGVYESFEFPGSKRTDGLGINEDGVIVGFYVDQDGKVHGYVRRR